MALNISCPNACGGQSFVDQNSLDSVLKAIFDLPKTKSMLIKLSSDLNKNELNDMIDILERMDTKILLKQ